MRSCRRQLSCVLLGIVSTLSATIAVAQTNTTTTTAISISQGLAVPQFDTSLGILQSVSYRPRLNGGMLGASGGSTSLTINGTATGAISVTSAGSHTHTVSGNFGTLLGVNLGSYSRDTVALSPAGTSSESSKSGTGPLTTTISVNSHAGMYMITPSPSAFTFDTASSLTAIAAGSPAATGASTGGSSSSGPALFNVSVGGTAVASGVQVPHTHTFTPAYSNGTSYTYIPSASTLVDSVQTYHSASVNDISIVGTARSETIGLNGNTLNLTASGTQLNVQGTNTAVSISGSAGSKLNTNGKISVGGGATLNVDVILAGTSGVSLDGGDILRLGGTESNTYAGRMTVDNGSVLQLNKANGATAITGLLDVNNSNVRIMADNQIADTAVVELNAATMTLAAGVEETIGGLNGDGNVSLLPSSTLTVAGRRSAYSGRISGPPASAATAVFIKDGPDFFRLLGSESNTFPGLTRVQGGTLDLFKSSGATAISGNVEIKTGAILNLSASEQIANTSNVSNDGGLFDVGSHTETIASLNQLSAESRTTIASGGALHVGKISNAGLIEVATGGALTATEISNSGSIVNNGSFTGNMTLENGGTLSGVGTVVGNLVVGDGGVLAPGNSPGRLLQTGDVTFMPGGSFLFQINDALGNGGNDPGWSAIPIIGLLDLSSLSLSAAFTIDVTSLTLGNVAGLAANFDKFSNYRWRWLNAVGGIQGFDPAAFLVSLDNFQNDWTGGRFSVSRTGNFLFLDYEAARLPEPQSAPEPASLAIFAAAFAGFFGINARRRRGRRNGG